jgi:hypothetical protein
VEQDDEGTGAASFAIGASGEADVERTELDELHGARL